MQNLTLLRTIDGRMLQTALTDLVVAPGTTYSVVDNSSQKAPANLRLIKQGEDLLVYIDDKEVIRLEDFYLAGSTAQYSVDGSIIDQGNMPGKLIANQTSGAEAEGIVWQADSGLAAGDSPSSDGGSNTGYLIAGGLAVAAGIAVALDDDNKKDTTAPIFESASTATAIDENSGAEQVIYTALATDKSTVTYSLKGVDDHAAFTIDASSGAVTLNGDPDYESQSSYSFTVVATDEAGNTSEQEVTLQINDVGELDTSIVVFDLINGTSSDHSDRTFDADTSYTIYIRVDSTRSHLEFSEEAMWSGVLALGSDDTVIMVGSGSAIVGTAGQAVEPGEEFNSGSGAGIFSQNLHWHSSLQGVGYDPLAFAFSGESGTLSVLRRGSDTPRPSFATIASTPSTSVSLNSPLNISPTILSTMPAGILNSQGLA